MHFLVQCMVHTCLRVYYTPTMKLLLSMAQNSNRYEDWLKKKRTIFSWYCDSSERSANYAKKMVRMLLSSTCEEQRTIERFYVLKCITRVKLTGTCVACMRNNVWTIATSQGGAHCSRNFRLEECAPPSVVGLVHTVFHIHATHVPVNFTRVMPSSPQKSH